MPPAQNLIEAYQAADPRPLPSGDPYYVDLTEARASQATMRLRQFVENCAAGKFASIAFSGHRGSGKSTELHRLESDLSTSCFSLYLAVDDFLDASDVEYTDLFLLISRRLLEKLSELGVSIGQGLLDAVESWFRTVTKESEESVSLSAGIATEASAGISISFLMKLLAKLTADIKAGSSAKTTTRTELDRYFSGLLNNTNLLLNDASRALQEAGKPSRIIVLLDNLDRMPPKKGESLFFDHGAQLQDLNCHTIFTISIDTYYSPRSIATIFPRRVLLPNIKLREGKSSSAPNNTGIDALRNVVAKRWDVARLFHSPSIIDEIIRFSGGSVTQLMGMLSEAALSAQARDLSAVDARAAQEAAVSIQQDFVRSLFPDDYTLLATTAKTHEIQRNEAYLRLMWTRAILEYNGNEIWHDTNPLIESIDAFKEAKRQLRRGASSGRRGR